MKKITIIFLFVSFFNINTFAVDSLTVRKKTKMFFEIGVSANSYKGSITEHYGNYTSSFHLAARFANKKRMNGKLNFSYGAISSQNTSDFVYKDNNQKNIYPIPYFHTSLFNLSYELNFVLIKRKHWASSFFVGVGFSRFNVKDETGNDLINNSSSRAKGEDYNSTSLIFPLGLNVEYIWKDNIRTGFSMSNLNQKTDFFDNTSTYSPYVTVRDNVLMLKWYLAFPFEIK